ncbi:MAG: hypothetical protein DWQ36_08205 [Acidobacteria bacterium]|nr:MAG: hypothetical protein DWQ30_01930 [Acidobacteriota bacterium]REK08790.1 MAG: hypothetical protein DWQ36_08205 [Acidobacteriota bacterium]
MPSGARQATAVLWLCLAICLCGLSGCASTQQPGPVLRAAVDVPERFEFAQSSSDVAPGRTEGEPVACLSPLVDRRDGTRIVLERSVAGRGDYSAPAGRYGLASGELLRVDCTTGEVLGVVHR